MFRRALAKTVVLNCYGPTSADDSIELMNIHSELIRNRADIMEINVSGANDLPKRLYA